MKKRILPAVLSIVLLLIALMLAQAVLIPSRYDNREGHLLCGYYGATDKHDVIFVGDCEIYEGIVPAVLYEQYGMTSYVRGSSQQTVWQSYHVLEETLAKDPDVKVVVFNVLALKYGKTPKESISRMTLEDMRWSPAKLQAIKASMTEDESFLSYFMPILRYHDRWSELTAADLAHTFSKHEDMTHQGYLMQTDIVPVDPADTREPDALIDSTLPARSMEYLDKMKDLCAQYGAELVLIKAPTNSVKYYWYDEWDAQIVTYAQTNNLTYYNFIGMDAELGLDWSTDTYDAGLHLNVYGAEKWTLYLGNLLMTNHGVQDRRGDAALDALWAERIARYTQEKQQGVQTQ